MRKTRNGDQPPYAWLCGLLAVAADPENTFEWVGVLREVFAVADAELAARLYGGRRIAWDEPESYGGALGAALRVVRPFIETVDTEGVELGGWIEQLVAAVQMRARLQLIDAGGALEAELDRLLAHAAELGREGAGPREFLTGLLAALDDGRPAGKPAEDAVNLLTCHSAKGLEWPVVIPLGLWRGLVRRTETGLRVVRHAAETRVFFDAESLPEETKAARDREWRREQARLLYVTLTRARRQLVLPWNPAWAAECGVSFAELWGATELWEALPEVADHRVPGVADLKETAVQPTPTAAPVAVSPKEAAGALSVIAERLLPHQLAAQKDVARGARHESVQELPAPAGREDPVDYGVWWHETMEFLPWSGDEEAVARHGAEALAQAERLGFGGRGATEWRALMDSAHWCELRRPRWRKLTEVAVLAPWRDGAWVDGVIDLVAHDAVARELWVTDWKTNRRRAGESLAAWLDRLVGEYREQLAAYGRCLTQFFPECRARLWIYASGAGECREVL
jgi:ATP-dependent exoDNAse (exonuclease V) beta subunit